MRECFVHGHRPRRRKVAHLGDQDFYVLDSPCECEHHNPQQRRCCVHGHSRRDSQHHGGEQLRIQVIRVVVFTFTAGIYRGALQREVTFLFETLPAPVHERVSTTSFVVLILGNWKPNHLGAQGSFDPIDLSIITILPSLATSTSSSPRYRRWGGQKRK